MFKKKDAIVTSEVEKRLDDLFGPHDEHSGSDEATDNLEESAITELEDVRGAAEGIDDPVDSAEGESGEADRLSSDKEDHEKDALEAAPQSQGLSEESPEQEDRGAVESGATGKHEEGGDHADDPAWAKPLNSEEGGSPSTHDKPVTLRGLKAVLLSMEWEITDDILTAFFDQIERLRDEYKDERFPQLFLQLLTSAGRYIRTTKANAHPDAIKMLNSVYRGLEKVVVSKDMTEAGKQKILLVEVERFKKLKRAIALRRASPDRKSERKPAGEINAQSEAGGQSTPSEKKQREAEEAMKRAFDPGIAGMLPHEAFAHAVEEIKEVIKAEFRTLRVELKLWREGQ
jgi:hypothetical protein